jgi:hypothetical protein
MATWIINKNHVGHVSARTCSTPYFVSVATVGNPTRPDRASSSGTGRA